MLSVFEESCGSCFSVRRWRFVLQSWLTLLTGSRRTMGSLPSVRVWVTMGSHTILEAGPEQCWHYRGLSWNCVLLGSLNIFQLSSNQTARQEAQAPAPLVATGQSCGVFLLERERFQDWYEIILLVSMAKWCHSRLYTGNRSQSTAGCRWVSSNGIV